MEVDLTNTRLETERLILRPITEDDADDMFEYASVPGVGEMAGWKHHMTREESLRVIRMFIAEKNILAIVLKENNKVIGTLGLHPSWADEDPRFADQRQREVGYVLSKAYWGRGLVPEAVKRIIKYCFDELGYDAVSVGHFKGNEQSRRVIEKCGFSFVKNGEHYCKQLDTTFETLSYIILRK